MRVFSGALATETNTFSPIPTDMADYKATLYCPAGEHPEELTIWSAPLWLGRQYAAERDWELIEGLCTGAQPGGMTTRSAYEALRDELLDDLRQAGEVDIIALQLHGAMVANGYPDCEGDLLQRMREIAPNAVIGALLDPHCHTTPAMMSAADILIMMKEYPHTDAVERSHELLGLCERAARKEIKPRHHYFHCGQVSMYHTTEEPMLTYVREMQAAENGEDILSLSLGHGFPWGDVPDMGTHVLVVSDNAPESGERVAAEFGRKIQQLRGQTCPERMSLDTLVQRLPDCTNRPVICADASDNAGGGAPSDSTFVVQRLLVEGYTHFAVAMIWDPMAVSIAKSMGAGARMPLRIGGKACRMSGPPLDLNEVEVVGIVENAYTDFAGAPWPVGDLVGVKSGETLFILHSLRSQCFHPDVFFQLGLDPRDYPLIVVKSSQHFRAGFAEVAGEVLYLGAPGVNTMDLSTLPFKSIRRPLWPLDQE
ncbi:MAG: M81 family metallopeptidase [Pseudomonadota bacterium]